MTLPMPTTSHSVSRRIRAIGGIGLLSLSMLAGSAGIAQAASVTPIPIDSGNPDCGDFAEQFGGSWTEFKLEGADLANGTHTDGTLSITISNFQNSSDGTPGSCGRADHASAITRTACTSCSSGRANGIRSHWSAPPSTLKTGPGARCTPRRSTSTASCVALPCGIRTHSDMPPSGRRMRSR